MNGQGYDSIGQIARKEWKIGGAEFVENSGKLSFVAPSEAGDLIVLFRVTDDDNLSVIDTVIIHVMSRTQASLTDLRVSHGTLSPSFHPNDTVYRDTVPYAVSEFSVTPFGNGILTVDSDTITSGVTSSEYLLEPGENIFRIVTRLDSVSIRVYWLYVVRKSASRIMTLDSLVLSVGSLSPDFSPHELVYTVAVTNSTLSMTVSPILSDSTSTLQVNDTLAKSGKPFRIDLSVGENRINVKVTSQNGEKQTYTILVKRAANVNADLLDLEVSTGNLTPDFLATTTEYKLTVENQVSSITLTPTLSATTSKVEVNGIAVNSGAPSAAIALILGSNTIKILVTAEAGNTKDYTVNLVRKVIPKVRCGESHSLFIKDDGSTWVAGYNYYGQLGDSTTTDKTIPTQIMRGSTFTDAAGGFAHSLLLKNDGTLWATGYNYNGQLGDGTNTPKFTPTQVMKNSTIAQMVASSHSLMLMNDGTLWATGSNFAGQLGDGTTANKTTPTQVLPGSTFTRIATGDGHSLMLKSDGTLWGMGLNRYGQLGDGTDTTRLVPIQLMKGSIFFEIAAGGEISLMIKTDGTLWATGHNLFGQLGDGTDTTRLIPIQVMPGSTFIQIATGGRHSLMVKSDGTLWATGAIHSNVLDEGGSTNVFTPILVFPEPGIKQVAAGRFHSLILKSDGTFWAMGDNTHGQLGDGSKVTRAAPVQINVE